MMGMIPKLMLGTGEHEIHIWEIEALYITISTTTSLLHFNNDEVLWLCIHYLWNKFVSLVVISSGGRS